MAKDLEGFTEDEIAFVLSMMDDNMFGAEVTALEYKKKPVDMETFILDPYYLGIVGRTLFPVWIDDLIELFSGEYHEAILTGAIGTGKTTFAHIAVIRMLYETSCLRNPQGSYGIMDGTPICFANVGVNKTNAQKVVFEGIASKLNLSQYFMDEFRPTSSKTKEIVFADNIQITPGSSTETGIIGMNVFGGIIDEINFHDRTKQNVVTRASHSRWGHYSKAETLYAAIQRRMKSRFMRNGKLPGILMLVSSKQTVSDFTEKRIRESTDDPHVFVRDYSQWDAKGRSTFSGKSFKVLVGNDKVRSRILDDSENTEAFEKKDDSGRQAFVLEVPDDFRGDFEKDLEGSIRDIGGISTIAISNFIQKREKIYEMVNKSRRHPFSSVGYDMSKGGGFLWDQLVRKTDNGELEPLINPGSVRHAHIDLALTGDCAGLCIGHVSHRVDVIRRRKTPDGKEIVFKEIAPYIVIDLILQIIPPLGDEIEIAGIRQLLYDLSDHGYPLRFISMDSFQSRDSIQQFGRKGFKAEIISVDVNSDPYDAVKTALYENRLDCYEYKVLTDELKSLEKDTSTGKIDHTKTGSKDCSDALAGVVYSLTTRLRQELPFIERGISERPLDEGRQDDLWVMQGRLQPAEGPAETRVEMPLPFLKG